VVSARPAHPLLVETIALARPRARAVITDPRFVAYKSRLLDAVGAFRPEASVA
jgi:hypothetical protein